MKNIYSDITEYQVAEYVWPTSTYIDHLGERHIFRKYIHLGGIGLFDEKNGKILLHARAQYRGIYINPYYETISVGLYSNHHISWEIYSFNGTRLFPDILIRNKEEVLQKLVEYRKNWDPV